jgi:hypothetical protein
VWVLRIERVHVHVHVQELKVQNMLICSQNSAQDRDIGLVGWVECNMRQFLEEREIQEVALH